GVRLADVLGQLVRLEVGPRDVRGRVPLARHRLFVVPLDVVRPHLALAVHVGLEVGQTVGQRGAARREAPVLPDHLRHLAEAVAADVEVAEGEAAAGVLGAAADTLARLVEPGEVEVAFHRPLETVDERLVLREVGRAEIAHGALLSSGVWRAGGRLPSGEVKSTREARSKNSWKLSAKRE